MHTRSSASSLCRSSLITAQARHAAERTNESHPKATTSKKTAAGKGLHIRGNYTRYANAASCPSPLTFLAGAHQGAGHQASSPPRRAPHSRSETRDMETHTNHPLKAKPRAIPSLTTDNSLAGREEPRTSGHRRDVEAPRIALQRPTRHHSRPGTGRCVHHY